MKVVGIYVNHCHSGINNFQVEMLATTVRIYESSGY